MLLDLLHRLAHLLRLNRCVGVMDNEHRVVDWRGVAHRAPRFGARCITCGKTRWYQ